MQAFKLYMKILNKKKGILLMYLVIFTVIWFALTQANAKDMNKQNLPFKNTSVSVAYIDHDQSTLSQSFTKYLNKVTKVKILDHNAEAIKDALFMNEVNYIITIPKGFEEHFTTGDEAYSLQTQKKANATEGFLAEQLVNEYLTAANTYKKANPALSYQQIDKQVQSLLKQTVNVELSSSKDVSLKQEMIKMFFNTLGYILLSIMILVGASILTSVYRSDVHIRTLASPISNTSFNTQLFFANICFGTSIWAIFMILSVIINPTLLSKVGILYGINSFTFTLVSLSFAFLCANLLRGIKNSDEAINGITNAFALGSCFIGGNFVPQAFLSQQVLNIASFLPNYWYVKINDYLPLFKFNNADSWQLFGQSLGIQWLFIIAFFLGGLVISRIKQQVRNIT